MVLKAVVLLGLLAVARAGIDASGGVSDIQQTQDDIGNYAFDYNVADPFSTKGRSESGDEYGNKKGHYYLSDADGRSRRVDYVADEFGFRATVNTNEPGTMDSAPASTAFYSAGAPEVVVKTPAKVVAPAYTAPVLTPGRVVAPAYAAPVRIFRPAIPAAVVAPTYAGRIHAPRVFAPSYGAHYAPAPANVIAPAYAAHRYVSPHAPLLSHTRVVAPAYTAPVFSHAPAYTAPLLSHTRVVAPAYTAPVLSHAPAYTAPLLSHTRVVAPAYTAPVLSHAPAYTAPLLSHTRVVAPAPVLSHAKVVAPAYAAAPVLSHGKVVAPAYAAPVVPSYSTSTKTIVHHAAPAPAIVKVH